MKWLLMIVLTHYIHTSPLETKLFIIYRHKQRPLGNTYILKAKSNLTPFIHLFVSDI